MRFRIRHLHKTVADFLEAELALLGWVNAPVNFGVTPVTFLEFQPDASEIKTQVLPNTVAITVGDEQSASDEELGDGLKSIDFPLFVDIYGEKRAIAQSIASDVKDLLSDRYLYITDFTGAPTVTNEQIEIAKESVFMETPPAAAAAQDIRRNWIVVKATLTVFYV